jgi:hypothetical protein
VVASTSFLVHEPWLIPDEGQYVELAATVAAGEPAERWAPGYGQSLYDSTWAFVAPLRFLFDIFGPSRFVGQMWAIALGVATAVATAWIVLRFLGARWGLLAGLVVALFPSQLLWSSVVLRESAVWLGLALVAVAVELALRRRGPALLVPTAVACGGLAALALLRPQTMVGASWALALTALVVRTRQYLVTAVGGILIAAAAPAVTGFGLFGLAFVLPAVGDTGEVRERLAEGASSAFVHDVDEDHVDVVLDPSVRHLPHGLVAVTLRPFPWEEATSTGIMLARVENLLWIALYGFGVLGLVLGRRLWRHLAFPFALVVIITGGAALTQGNLGTAFRHRGQVFWALVVLAAVGAQELYIRCVERREEQVRAGDVIARSDQAAVGTQPPRAAS